jgi:hypothetical protein
MAARIKIEKQDEESENVADSKNKSSQNSESQKDIKDTDSHKSMVSDQDDRKLFAMPFLASDEVIRKKDDQSKLNIRRQIIDVNAVLLRVDREVQVQEETLGELTYVRGSFIDVDWAALDGLTRAVGALLSVMLGVPKDAVMFGSGFVVGNNKMFFIAQFSLVDELRISINNNQLLQKIGMCIDRLKDEHLWDYTEPLSDDEEENKEWEIIEAVRKSRQEIPGKQLPFSCTLGSAESKMTLKIGPELARAKQKKIEEKEESGVGKLTGYCTHERIIKFKINGTESSIKIGFDEDKFIESIFEYSGRNPHVVEVKWLSIYVEKNISYRTLVELNCIMKPLL